MPVISVRDLRMTYRAPVRQPGLGAALRSLVRPRFRQVEAVRSLSFDVREGEVVGFIGPNGAGKTTTLKMLSGVLHPTSGTVNVLGFRPDRRESRYLRQIAMIRGSRPIGAPGELTVMDALRFQRLIYEVPRVQFEQSLEELADLLELDTLLDRQVRALSLGERMRCGLAWSLVYRPRVLFLDEPTIGLDVAATAVVRRFIARYSERTGATVLLTSHYMADVETLCPRVILIDHGTLLFDGRLRALAARLAPHKVVRVTVKDGVEPDWSRYTEVTAQEGPRATLQVDRAGVTAVTARLLAELPVVDLSIEEPPLESVIRQIYAGGSAA